MTVKSLIFHILRCTTSWKDTAKFHDMLFYRGVDRFDRLYRNMELGIIWLSASTDRKNVGRCVQCVNELEF